MLTRIRIILWKEFVQIRRDARTLAVVVLLPVMMVALYGYAINMDVKHLRLGVYDQDRTHASRDLIGAFSHSEYFDLTDSVDSYPALRDALDRGTVKAALVIPLGYARDVAARRTVPVQILIDGSDSTSASTAMGYARAMVQQHGAELVAAALRESGVPAGDGVPIDSRLRFWYNPELRSTDYIVPGLIAVILTQLAVLLTSITVARERERGTIEPLIVSPVTPVELMVGKMIPYVIIAFGDVLLIIAAARLLFHVPLVGSAALLLALTAVFLVAVLGIGLLVSVISPNQQSAMMTAVMTTQLPASLLSGFFFPVSAMPKPVQWISYLVPARHFLVIVRAIFLKGAGLDLLWQPALFLVVYAALMIWLSARQFKKSM